MVFESIVADLLNRFLNKYVDNVDSTQLNIGIWGGDVMLEKLALKQGALDALELPIKTTYGYLGKLVLKIPWKNLYTAPVVMSIENVFLLAVPNREVAYDPVKEENLKQEAKQEELRIIEEAKKAARVKDAPSLDPTFLEKLGTQIAKNLQIKISGIHIRYEDRQTHVGRPFAIGVTLHHFYVCTTDENWNEKIIEDNVIMVNKIVDIDSLAVYWNCNTRLFTTGRAKHDARLNDLPFEQTICTRNYLPHNFQYVLGPINASIKSFLNTKPELNNFETPKFQVNIQLSKLAVGINKLQYHDMIRLAEYFNRLTVASPYRKYRPLTNTYKGNYEVWWRFAYTCILEELIRPARNNWRWARIAQHRETCRQYASVYREKLISKKPSEQIEVELNHLEADIDVFNIVLIRERVEVEVECEGLLHSQQDDEEGWIAWLRSTKVGKWFINTPQELSSGHVQQRLETSMTKKEKTQLYTAIGYTEHSTSVGYPTSFVMIEGSFNLDSFEVKISENLSLTSVVLFLKLSTVKADLEQRPAIHGIKVNMSIVKLTVFGITQGNFTPVLVTSTVTKNTDRLLDVLFELNPLDHVTDQRLHLNFRALEIVYDSETLQKMNEIFRAPHLRSFHQLHDHLENVKHMSASGLRYAIENRRSSLDLQVDIQASYLILPCGGIYTHEEDILVFNIGHVNIVSSPRITGSLTTDAMRSKGIPTNMIMKTMISHSYDKFVLNLKATQVLIALKGEDWCEILLQNKVSPLHILEPMSLIIIFNKCLITDDPKLPIFKITVSVPNVGLSVTDLRLRKLLVLLLSIPKLRVEEVQSTQYREIEETIEVDRRSSSHFQLNEWSSVLKRRLSKRQSTEINLKKENILTVKKVQAIQMDLTCQVENLSLQYMLAKSSTSEKFLTLSLFRIEFEMVQQTFDIDIVARIGGIFLNVFQVDGTIQIIDTPMARRKQSLCEYLFTINVILVDEASPDLYTKHDGTSKYLHINFTTINVLLHQEAILQCMQTLHRFVHELKKELILLGSKYSQIHNTNKSTPNINFSNIQRNPGERMKERSSIVVQSRFQEKNALYQDTAFRLQFDLKKVKVGIANCSTTFGEIAVKGCSVKASIFKTHKKLIIRVGKVEVLDCHRGSIHPRILSVVGDEMLSLELIAYTEKQPLFNYEGNHYPDILLTAQIACVRIVYLNRFVSLLLTFINKMKILNVLFKDGTFGGASPPLLQQNATQMVDATYIKFNIDLSAPILIVPLNCRSLDAIMLDLGFLTINNERQALKVVNGDGIPAYIDCIELKLENIKVERVKLTNVYEVVNATSLLVPVNFFISVERNLSMSWHSCIPACSISMRLKELDFDITEEDYKTIMFIIYQNFAESSVVASNDMEVDKLIFQSMEITNPEVCSSFQEEDKIDETFNHANASQVVLFKLTFFVGRISVTIYTGGVITLDDITQKYPKSGLARFTLETLCLQSLGLSNQKQMNTFRIVNCFLDDIRKENADRAVRLLQRKDGTILIDQDDFQDDLEFPSHTLVDISYIDKGTDSFLDVYVHCFRLILSLEYMVKLEDFFFSHLKSDELRETSASAKYSLLSTLSAQSNQKLIERGDVQLNSAVSFKLEKPDILIVENVNNPGGDALTISTEIVLKLCFSGKKIALNATMTELQLNSCCFNSTEEKPQKGIILRPCTISVLGSSTVLGYLNLDICVTEIKVNVSPTTIQLFRRMHAVKQVDLHKQVRTDNDHGDQSEIWKPTMLVTDNFWFLKDKKEPVVHFNVLRRNSLTPIGLFGQICVISIPSFIVFIEAGQGKWRKPMIFMHTKLDCIIYDWSYNLLVSNNISLQVDYYNASMASWEPLIELIERPAVGKCFDNMWELKVDVRINSSRSQTPYDSDRPSDLNITLSSQQRLEVTLTKTSIDILSKVGYLFLDTSLSPVVGSALAPFVVKNMSGLVITIHLSTGPFKVAVMKTSRKHPDIMLASGSQVGLCLRDDDLIQSNEATSEYTSGRINERYLSIKVTVADKEYCDLSLPVFHTDMRYVSLKHCGEYGDLWGLLWNGSLWEGSTVLTLRSIVTVHNHLKQQIHVFYSEGEGSNVVRVGTVLPNNELTLPIQSLYTATGALFFSAKGYKVTNEPFVWKDLTDINDTIHKLLKFSNMEQAGEPFFINIVGFRKSTFFENTRQYSKDSAIYSIHLRPGVKIRNYLPLDTAICFQGSSSNYEVEIKAGERVHMLHVEPGVSKLFVKIPNYLNTEWSSEDNVQWDTDTFHVLKLTSNKDNKKRVLEIRIFTKESNGSISTQITCQFWMLNKTDLNLAYRQLDEHDNTCNHDKTFKDIVLFSLWGAENAKKRVAIKIASGEWSDKFSLDAAGSSGVVDCRVDNASHYIGVNISLTTSKLTKQVTFMPYYVLVNNHQHCIECQEADFPDNPWVAIEPVNCTPFWPNSLSRDKELRLRFRNTLEMSIPFSYFLVHTTLIRLDNKYGAVYVDVHKMEGAIYITFWPYKTGLAPTLMINHTANDILFWEQNDTETIILASRETLLFTWRKPTGSRTITYRIWNNVELTDDLQKDGIEELSCKSRKKVYWVSLLDGAQRVTLFTEDDTVALITQSVSDLEPALTDITLSIHSIGISLVNTTAMKELLYITFTNNDAIWEARKSIRKRFKPLSLEKSQLIERAYKKYVADTRIGRETMNVVQLDKNFEVDLETKEMILPSKKYLQRILEEGVWFRVKIFQNQVTMHGKIARLQLDNQLSNSVYPVVLAPVPPPTTVNKYQQKKPFAELSIVRRCMEHSPVKHYKYFMILVQAFHVKVEIDFVNALSEFFDLENEYENAGALSFAKDLQLAREPLKTSVYSLSSFEEKNFYDVLHFSPLKIHLSFSLSTNKRTATKEYAVPYVTFILYSLGVTLADFQDVVLKLGCFERKYTFLSHRQRRAEVVSHYTSQFLKQTYVLVLGLDLIGNPWGFLMGIRQGVTDLFYEPYRGIIQGPEDFGEGLMLGIQSMFGNTVGGTFSAVSKITGAIGTGVAVLTFDDSFQHRRLETTKQARGHAGSQLSHAGKNLVMGAIHGITGVVANPVRGARNKGTVGFFRGVVRGLAGLVVRPAVGVFDFVSGSMGAATKGTKRVEVTVGRVRQPRYISKDGHVRPYSQAESEGNMVLEMLDDGRFADTDTYEYHVPGINQTTDILLLTNNRIIYVWKTKENEYHSVWTCTWENMLEPSMNKNTICITTLPMSRRKSILASTQLKIILPSTQLNTQEILIKSKKERQFLVNKIQELQIDSKRINEAK